MAPSLGRRAPDVEETLFIGFLKRLLGQPTSEAPAEPPESSDVSPEVPAAPEPPPVAKPALVPVMDVAPAASCPYCAMALVPPPVRSRLCPHCRQSISVRRFEGRTYLLADDAVLIFDAQRQKEEDEARWTASTAQWLAAAANLGADAERRARLAEAPISAQVADDSRALYLTTAEATVRTARREKRWKVVSRVRRAMAAHLYAEAGRPIPPPDDILGFHRDGLLAELRALQETSKVAELTSAGCCPTCRRDDGQSFPIATELRAPRLPHEGCPKGLCGCDWWMARPAPKKRRRRKPVAPA